MEPIVRHAVPALTPADPAVLSAALSGPATREAHDALAARLPALSEIAVRPPRGSVPSVPDELKVAAWNMERAKFIAPSAALLRSLSPDIVLLSEMDVGMARSGNRDTVAALADDLGMGSLFGIEFVELGLGNETERSAHAGETNCSGWHGNAILSRWPLEDAMLIRVGPPGSWFTGEGDQRRLGARMAIAARLVTPSGPVWLVSVHLESRSTPASRADETARLLAALPDDPRVLIGGDLNTDAMSPGELPPEAMAQPERIEPLFGRLAAAGFSWRDANTADVTQRVPPDGRASKPFRRIDWMAVRGLAVRGARTVAAADANGASLSDHEIVFAQIDLRG